MYTTQNSTDSGNIKYGLATMENSTMIPQKIKHTITV